MNYSNEPSMVRVDFWKPSGKWYCTEEIKWDRYNAKASIEMTVLGIKYSELIHETFKRCLCEQLEGRLEGMTATCLEPYHEHAHPLMVKDW